MSDVDAIDSFLRGGADPGTPLRRLAPLPGGAHDYDELIDSLYVFLQALIRTRNVEAGVVVRKSAAAPAAKAGRPPTRDGRHGPRSEETRAKMRAAAIAREQKKRRELGVAR